MRQNKAAAKFVLYHIIGIIYLSIQHFPYQVNELFHSEHKKIFEKSLQFPDKYDIIVKPSGNGGKNMSWC